ncbi:hypothetical protein Q4Q34_06210 [Flavivirga abyssicola]|uniref:hypothetical protein n=1 Tax=Flavivirga abyssicola TaxID=3063533 RepID=UPI0026E0C024|nr:hypothetical protein [Flavivirga sp. MEBiC07777]WVK14622.1 hypothetical protein Q4Q34_06210 [Flavivirga sp. MEBiC07777]
MKNTILTLALVLFYNLCYSQEGTNRSEDFDWDTEFYLNHANVDESVIIEGCENATDKKSCFDTKFNEILNKYPFECSDCKDELKIMVSLKINKYRDIRFGGLRTNNKMFNSQYSKNGKKRKKIERFLLKKIKIIKPAKLNNKIVSVQCFTKIIKKY